MGQRRTHLTMTKTQSDRTEEVRKPRPPGTVTQTTSDPLEDAKKVLCETVKSARMALGLPVDEWDKDRERTSGGDVDKFYEEVEKEVSEWVKQVQQMDEELVGDVRKSLEAVYEQLNRGSSLQWSRQAKAAERVITWRAIRKQTDPSTKNLLISIERIRRKYDQQVYKMTDQVRPWTEDEIKQGVINITDSITGTKDSLSAIQRDLEKTTDSITGAVKPLMPQEVEKFSSEIDLRWKYGVQAAEEELCAGVERARYNIWRRTKRRSVEEGAATLSWRDGALYATALSGNISVPVLEGVGPGMYIDDIDDVHVFLGVQQAQELAQHVVRLGVFPASSGRWLSCARQKLWWMTPDVG
jgi:hypothetical protein